MNVVLYSTGCPRCKILKSKLDKKGITYSVVDDVDKMLNMGMTVVPVLEVDGVRMSFKEAINWINNDKQ